MKTRIYANFIICALGVFLLWGIGFADILYLKNGKQITGKTVMQDAEKVVFRIVEEDEAADVTFFSDEILRIDKTDVSELIEFPFPQGKGIKFPRPVLKDVLTFTNQTITEPQDQPGEMPAEDMSIQPEAKISPENIMQKKDFLSDADREALLKQKGIIEELLPLLTKEEKDYFTKINSAAGATVNKIKLMLPNNPQSLSNDNPMEVMKEMYAETSGIIDKLTNIEPPKIFENFHKKYLDELSAVHEVMGDMSKGNIMDSFNKLIEFQGKELNSQQELEKILAEKKKEKENNQ